MTYRDESGFTLMEVVLAISVASGVVLAVFAAFGLIDSIRLRQEGASLALWEGDLVVHRLALLTHAGFTVPAPGERGTDVVLADGRRIVASGNALFIEDGATSERLSSPWVRITSVSFGDEGSAEAPGMLSVEFRIGPAASGSTAGFMQPYRTRLYAY